MQLGLNTQRGASKGWYVQRTIPPRDAANGWCVEHTTHVNEPGFYHLVQVGCAGCVIPCAAGPLAENPKGPLAEK